MLTLPGDNTPLRPVDSPVTRKAGYTSSISTDTNLTVSEWVVARHKAFREDVTGKTGSQMVNGVAVPIYT